MSFLRSASPCSVLHVGAAAGIALTAVEFGVR